MISVTQLENQMREVLEEGAERLAKETGFIQRERAFSGAEFVQLLVFGWLQEPEASLDDLTQVAQEREVTISAPGLSQRFTEQAAAFLQAVLTALVQVVLPTEPVDIPLLKRFSAVIVEDSSTVALPDDLKDTWQGCGGNQSHTQAAVKLHVRWDLLNGTLWGPRLTAGRVSDQQSPFKQEALPEESLYIADEGYLSLSWLKAQAEAKRFFLVRPKNNTAFFDRKGQRLHLENLLPRRVGQSVQLPVLVGTRVRLLARLLIVRVPPEVAEQRREHLRETARKHGKTPTEQQLFLANWTIVITNVSAKRLSVPEALVLLGARWQIELLFKLWKSQGKIDEWRSKNPWRILCELYAKLMAMVIQHWMVLLGTWHDAHRSLVKAAAVVRRSALAFLEVLMQRRSLTSLVDKLTHAMQSGCRLNTRATHPNTSQLLLAEVRWALT